MGIDAPTHPSEVSRLEPADDLFMRQALLLADAAAELAEVPVGAVVVLDGVVIGRGHNRQICDNDPTAHAEVVAMRAASAHLGNYRLGGATLYSTIEPCTMCVGTCVHARIARIVYGAPEPRAGALELLAEAARPGKRYNHVPLVAAGCLAAECGEKLRQFFRARRSEASGAGALKQTEGHKIRGQKDA